MFLNAYALHSIVRRLVGLHQVTQRTVLSLPQLIRLDHRRRQRRRRDLAETRAHVALEARSQPLALLRPMTHRLEECARA